jgi:murein DD-endopeptidase MepM/ murein hydrolase activator NlpD
MPSDSIMPKAILSLLLALLMGLTIVPVSAQTATPEPGPVYVVQSGDTLWDIATRFNVNLSDLVAANNLASSMIFAGQQLVIPGLEGLSGTLVTTQVPFGETLRSLARLYRMDPAVLQRLNHLVSPAELYAGRELTLLQQPNRPAWNARSGLAAGETMLELAVKQNTDPWVVAAINDLPEPVTALPGDVFYLPSGSSTAVPGGLPPSILEAGLDPLPLTQGRTVQVKLTTRGPAVLSGYLGDYPLHFFPFEGDTQVALQGIHGMLEPGLYPLHIDLLLPDGNRQSFEQLVMVVSGDYLTEAINGVDPATIDPAITGPEDEWLLSLVTPITPDKYWQGIFQLPVDSQYCVRSKYGNRRTYNNGALHGFHSGVDFGICSEAHPYDVYAPADGVVVFTGLKTVRGNVTIIDHGWGIYSCYFHQDEIYVSVGQAVTPGELIGKIGATGRVTGAHLHWEIWVDGVQVDPLQWLDISFPH